MGLFGKSKDDKPKKADPKGLWEAYYQATQEQRWADAVDALRQLQKREPASAKILMKLGDVLQRTGATRDAVAAYHQAAEATVNSGFAQKALAIYKIILRLAPNDQQARERSQEIVEGIEQGTQEAVLPVSASVSEEADVAEGAAFEGYGSLDMSTEDPAPGFEVEREPEAEPDIEPGIEPIPGLELTAHEEPDELPHVESLVAPEPAPEVEPVPGLEHTAYEEPGAVEPAARPEGLEHSLLERDELDNTTDEAWAEFQLPSVFSFLLQDEQEEFIAKARSAPYTHGDAVIREGETGDTMYIVRRGTARVVTEMMGREVELALLGPGDFFGEVAFLTGRPRTASVVALGDLELLEIDKELLQETIDKNPLILDSLVELYHSRAQDTVAKIKGGGA